MVFKVTEDACHYSFHKLTPPKLRREEQAASSGGFFRESGPRSASHVTDPRSDDAIWLRRKSSQTRKDKDKETKIKPDRGQRPPGLDVSQEKRGRGEQLGSRQPPGCPGKTREG